MPLRQTVKVRLIFRDRSGNEASSHLYFPISTSADTVFAAVNNAIPIYNAVSNALIVRVVAEYEYYFTNLSDPSITSDVRKTLLLFYRNDENRINRLSLPSPRSGIFEVSGDYANIRIDMNNPAIVQWRDMTMADMVLFKTKEGDDLGSDLLTGGLAI